MKILVFSLATFCFLSHSEAQPSKPNLSNTCSNMLGVVSYFWKVDSLGTNGFRLYAYPTILNCKLDSVTIDLLINKLGAPNFTDDDNTGKYYCYYYFNGRDIPKEANKSTERLYIFFKVPHGRRFICEIWTGQFD